MQRITAPLVCVLFLFCASPSHAEETLPLFAGMPTSSLFKIAADIQRAVQAEGLTLRVRETPGPITNLERLADPGMAFALIPDHLPQLLAAETPSPATTGDLITVYPLHLLEIHLLARREIDSLQALHGRKVVAGAPQSATRLTAEQLFTAAGIAPQLIDHGIGEKALEMVARGEVDAVLQLGGEPIELFERLPLLLGDAAAQVHLLPLQMTDLGGSSTPFEPSILDPQSYFWLDGEIPTLAVRASLVTRRDYSRRQCEIGLTVVRALNTYLKELRATSKILEWQEVAPLADIAPWQPATCYLTQTHLGIAELEARPEITRQAGVALAIARQRMEQAERAAAEGDGKLEWFAATALEAVESAFRRAN